MIPINGQTVFKAALLAPVCILSGLFLRKMFNLAKATVQGRRAGILTSLYFHGALPTILLLHFFGKPEESITLIMEKKGLVSITVALCPERAEADSEKETMIDEHSQYTPSHCDQMWHKDCTE